MAYMIELAIKAVKNGKTRGQFIRENTSSKDFAVLQKWSDAYSKAMGWMKE